jgi:hypothetical protein
VTKTESTSTAAKKAAPA